MKSHILAVIIPAFNEKDSIVSVIGSLPHKIKGVTKIYVIVIDDGSDDGTSKLLPKGTLVVRHIKNRGLGRTFDEGLKYALRLKADIIVNLDADGQFDSQQIKKIISPIINGQADVVIGSRFISKNNYKTSFVKRHGNRLLALLVSITTGQRFFDVTCGFRAYSKEAALNLNIYDKFSYTLESLIDLALKGFEIKEMAVDVTERKHGDSKVVSSVLFYAIKSIAILIRNLRDHRPFHFFVLPGIITLTISLAGFIFLLVRFIRLSVLSPYRSILTISISLLAASLFLFGLGLLFDYLNKIKKNEEDILYYLKKNEK